MLKDKNAVITGARKGIGRATVEKFAAYGANVWACARAADEDFERDMTALSEKYGVWIKPVYFDLADEESIKAGIKGILAGKMPVDILVNNAGVAHGGMLLTTPVAKLREVFEINLFAQVLIMQYIGKYMIRQKCGSIVNVASVGGLETNSGYLAYGSSKAAFIWVTRSVSKELASYGIRVNAVAPGITDTNMGAYRSEEEIQKVVARTSLGRIAQPEEIAEAIAFLASDKAGFVTGDIFSVDGGRL